MILFPKGNVREGFSLECQSTSYLIYLAADRSLVTIRLPQWQHHVWEQLETLGEVDVDQLSEAMTSANAVSLEKARAAVEKARSMFAQIQAELRSVQRPRLPL